MEEKLGLQIVSFESTRAWESWLSEHHASSKGVWIKIARKTAGIPSVTYDELVGVALCYGWIDSQAGSYDESDWLQRFTPRGPRSKWSKINRAKVGELIESGRMQPAGLAAVELAKKTGAWERAYDSPSSSAVPDDLRAALDANPEAAAFFETLNSSNRYAILYRVHDAKRPETRARRIAKFIEMLSRGEKLY